MASTAISAQGSVLKVDDSIPGTADVPIKNLKTFSGFDGEAGELDVTNLDSVAKEYLAGLQDYGSFTLEWNPDYSDSGQDVMRAAQASGVVKTFELTLPNAKVAAFQGLVKNASSIKGGVDSALDGSVAIKITGDVTVT